MVRQEEGLPDRHTGWVRWDGVRINSQVASTWLHTQVNGELVPSAGASLPSLTPPLTISHQEDADDGDHNGRDVGKDERREECRVWLGV